MKFFSVFLDVSMLAMSLFLSSYIFGEHSYEGYYWFFISVGVISIFLFGIYRNVLSSMSFRMFQQIFISNLTSIFMIFVAFEVIHSINFGFFLVHFLLSLFLVSGWRLCYLKIYRLGLGHKRKERKLTLIYGAGNVGKQLVDYLKLSDEYKVFGFVDDNEELQNNIISSHKVYNPNSIERLVKNKNIKNILLAIPSLDSNKKNDIVKGLAGLNVTLQTVPDLSDIVSGRLKVTDTRKVSIDDLLGRDSVAPVDELMSKNNYGKVVVVTGAGGSIGSEICRQVLALNPKILILIDSSEFNLYNIFSELTPICSNKSIVLPFLRSVQNEDELEKIFTHYDVDTVYHAAAYKHVPLVEFNMAAGVKNNVFGTYSAASAALRAKVANFVLISTDKAVRPTNVMGATKRMAELGLQALSSENLHSCTKFSMVRFGNVLGSSGSVIPLFQSQLEKGGPLTVTHKDITRYFMTIPEAAQLVIQAGAMSKGGDVFVLDMGSPVKIYELAKTMIRLSGFTLASGSNSGGISIDFTGLRPGEKLYEELLIDDENVTSTSHPKIMRNAEAYISKSEFEIYMSRLSIACITNDTNEIRKILLDAPVCYQPQDPVSDLLF